MTQAGMEQAFEQVDTELADDDVLVVYLRIVMNLWPGSLPAGCGKPTTSPLSC